MNVMRDSMLDRLAHAYGVQLVYQDVTGVRHVASEAAKRALLQAMSVAVGDDAAVAGSLAAAPSPPDPTIAAPPDVRCFTPDWLEAGKVWGLTCQLYGLRSARNQGVGDFEDLAVLAEKVAADGGDFVGVNPLHALFTADPERCSPFSPSNRRFQNPFYIALDRLPGIRNPLALDEAAIARAREGPQVDYRAVAAVKLHALRGHWRALIENADLWEPWGKTAFEAFVEAGGDALRNHAVFEALSHVMVADGRGAGWHDWPGKYRDARSAAAARFAAEREDEVRFHQWLQWVADVQLAGAQKRARRAGMRIGLYLDLATGTAPDGSATWSDPDLVVTGATMGAPPDAFFAGGQNWGLAPLSPAALRARDTEPFRNVLLSVARHAGAIRLDHAMGLHRLFWIPRGMATTEGCYVLYPMADMVRMLAEVSNAQRSLVIGEDLGTVPRGFPQAMQSAGIFSSRVLYFERSRGGFRAVGSYLRRAFVSVSTHDLPPLAAWWRGGDVALFQSLGLVDAAGAGAWADQRRADRVKLVHRLRRDLPKRVRPLDDAVPERLTESLAVAIHTFLARTPSMLFGIQFEDLCGAEAPVNVPGTWKEYPNWRLRAPMTLEEAPAGTRWSTVVGSVARERPR